MAFSDIIKKIFSNVNKTKEIEIIKVENLTLPQLYEKLKADQKSINERKEISKKEINQIISNVQEDLKPLIKKVEDIDIDKRKDFEKVKTIVKENRSLYITTLHRFVSDLQNLKELDVDNFHKNLNEKINLFHKNSRKAYEKATIYIGKELSDINSYLKDLLIRIDNIIKEQELSKNNLIAEIIVHFNELESLKSHEEEVNSDKLRYSQTLEEQKVQKNKLDDEIRKLKESSLYKSDLELKDKNKKELSAIEDEIQSLKLKINLRDIAKHHHYDESKRQLIANYSSNFKNTLLTDEKLELVNLVKEAKNLDIPQLSTIKSRLIALHDSSVYESDNKLTDLNRSMDLLNSKVVLTEQDLKSTYEKQERLKEKKDQIIKNILVKSKTIFPNLELVV